jgi:hypothetical protein
MAQLQASPLPSLGSLLDPAIGSVGAPATLPSFGLVLYQVVGTTLTAEAATYAYNPRAATLRYRQKLVAEAADAYAFDGFAVDWTLGGSNQGGDPAPLPSLSLMLGLAEGATIMPAAAAHFTGVVGAAVTLSTGHALAAGSAAYAYSVAPAWRDLQMNGAAATFAFAGEEATFVRAIPDGLVAESATYPFAGFEAVFIYERPGVAREMVCDPALYAYAVEDITFAPLERRLVAEAATYDFAGFDAALTGPLWTPIIEPPSVWTKISRGSTVWTVMR